MEERSPRLSIVLPCYNEAATLPELLDAYREAWEDLPAELILVDNGSTDETPRVLKRLLARPEHSFARTVTIEVNRGYGHGIATGLASARGQFLAWSHADMQCSPADPFRAWHVLTASHDPERTLVKGRRTSRRSGSATLVTLGMTVLSTAVLATLLTDINGQPKVFHRHLLELLADPPDGFQFDLYVLYTAKRNGIGIRTIPVQFLERAHGQSRWAATLRSRIRHILGTVVYLFRLRFGRASGRSGGAS